MKKQPSTTVRMSWETYAYLNSLVAKELEKLENEFRLACDYVSAECYPDGSSGHDRAYKTFRIKYNKIKAMQDELHESVKESYKDHPKQAMREFWGTEQ